MGYQTIMEIIINDTLDKSFMSNNGMFYSNSALFGMVVNPRKCV